MLVIALVAGFLAIMVALGLTGVLWLAVTRRTREIGLRRAKGATRGDIRFQILGEIVILTSFALLPGVLLALQLPLVGALPVPGGVYAVEPCAFGAGHLPSGGSLRLVPGAARGGASSRRRPCATSRGPMILVVDDDASVTASLALLLRQDG